MQYKVLLYYKYTEIKDPIDLQTKQRSLCEKLNLVGRILISTEGLNGSVCGEPENIQKYISETKKYPGLGDVDFKESESDFIAFNKLKVLIRDEVVALGKKKSGKDVDLNKKAPYIEPEDLLNMYENNDNFVIIDGRNNYEAKIGRFKNSIYFDVENFREIPDKLNEIGHLKSKKVVTFCTGGIRCEKFSALLIENGFEDVKQLHGGIHNYGVKAGGKYFDGEMYVFDKRVTIPVNKINPTVITNCIFCNIPVARYINCAHLACYKKIIVCKGCESANNGCCSKECEAIIKVSNMLT